MGRTFTESGIVEVARIQRGIEGGEGGKEGEWNKVKCSGDSRLEITTTTTSNDKTTDNRQTEADASTSILFPLIITTFLSSLYRYNTIPIYNTLQ